MEKKRPVGVVVAAVIFILIGGLFTLSSFFFSISEIIQGSRSNIFINLQGVLGLIIGTGYSLIPLIVGIGLFSLKSWARKMTLFVIPPFIMIAFSVSGWYYCRPLSKQVQILELVLSNKIFFIYIFLIAIAIISILLIYFTRPKVRSEFR